MSAMLTRREVVMALMPATTAVPPFQLFIIALTAFLTVVDLFATQALLPALTAALSSYTAWTWTRGYVCTLGMAIGGLAIALFSRRINRRAWNSEACWSCRSRPYSLPTPRTSPSSQV